MDNIYEHHYPESTFYYNHPVQARRTRALPLLAMLLLVLMSWYSLRFIPIFDVKSVVISVDGSAYDTPPNVIAIASEVKGTSLFALNKRALRSRLEALSVVERVKIKRKFFSSLEIDVTLAKIDAVLAGIDNQGRVVNLYHLDNGFLQELSHEDFLLFKDQAFVLQVDYLYAQHMAKYGPDKGLLSAFNLALEMKEHANLISKIIYANNSTEGFGNMELFLPTLNAHLSIRQVVSEKRVQEAIHLIRYEHERDNSRNIALRGELRYDLYNNSLVARR